MKRTEGAWKRPKARKENQIKAGHNGLGSQCRKRRGRPILHQRPETTWIFRGETRNPAINNSNIANKQKSIFSDNPGGTALEHRKVVISIRHPGVAISIALALVDGGLEREIEVAQSLLDGEHLNLFFIGLPSFGFGLFRKDVSQDLHDVKILRYRSIQIVVQNFQPVPHLRAFQVFP